MNTIHRVVARSYGLLIDDIIDWALWGDTSPPILIPCARVTDVSDYIHRHGLLLDPSVRLEWDSAVGCVPGGHQAVMWELLVLEVRRLERWKPRVGVNAETARILNDLVAGDSRYIAVEWFTVDGKPTASMTCGGKNTLSAKTWPKLIKKVKRHLERSAFDHEPD